jgi:uncharacterized membrane protein YphA (DoxX/SURF4 family)
MKQDGPMSIPDEIETFHELLAVLSAFVAILFIYSGIAKLLSLRSFSTSLLRVPYLPHRWSAVIGVLLPPIETLAGALMLFDWFWAKAAVIGLLLVFSAVAWVAHRRNLTVPCNCFGVDSSEHLTAGTALRNAILAAITAVSIEVPGRHVPPLTGIYGLTTLVLFLIVGKAVRNHGEFLKALEE